MTQADPQLELPARDSAPVSHARAGDSANHAGRHRVVTSLPPWLPSPPPPPPPPLAPLPWHAYIVEFAGLAVATVCFAAAICAAARALYLAEEARLDLGMFAALTVLGGSFTLLGCQVVQALGRWLPRARALNSARSSPDSDPSPRPPTPDSTC